MSDGTTYVVGLDGVPPSLLSGGIESGALPTFARLSEEGADGTTRSVVPPVSMAAWSTFATGQNPGNHGIFNFMLKDTSGYGTSFSTAETLRSNSVPFWEYLDAHGISCGVMNVMPGYPPSRARGFHISDHITTPPGETFASPPDLAEQFRESFDEFTIGPPTGAGTEMDHEQMGEYVERFLDIERDRISATRDLVEQRPCEVMVLVFSAPDVLLHEVGHLTDPDHPAHTDELADAYAETPMTLMEAYDDFLAWLVEQMDDEDTLLVLSDHGHSPIYSAVNLNAWLYQEGFLSLKSTPTTLLKRFGYNYLFDATKRTMKRLGLYHRIKRRVARSSGDGDGRNWADLLTLSQRDIDWDNTEAFTVAGDGQIYVNTTDHEQGRVSPSEYEDVRERIREALLDLEDPTTGDAVVAAVENGEDVYADGVGSRPDLVCIPEQGYRFTFPQTMQTRQAFVSPQKPSSHTSDDDRNGIFLAWGSGVTAGSDVEIALEDFAPTILHDCGMSVPDSMDGTVSDVLGSDESVQRRTYDGRIETKRAIRTVSDSLR